MQIAFHDSKFTLTTVYFFQKYSFNEYDEEQKLIQQIETGFKLAH